MKAQKNSHFNKNAEDNFSCILHLMLTSYLRRTILHFTFRSVIKERFVVCTLPNNIYKIISRSHYDLERMALSPARKICKAKKELFVIKR